MQRTIASQGEHIWDGEYTCPMHPEVRQMGPGKCPKCGMFLEPVRTPPSHGSYGASEHPHHDRHSHQGLAATPPSHAVKGVEEVEYTCPMHPEIRQIGPGHCPICGMALEPVLATAETGAEPRTAGHDAPLLDRRWR